MPFGEGVPVSVHGGIRHLEKKSLGLLLFSYVHGGIRHLEMLD